MAKPYVTIQSVLEEAGLWQRALAEEPAGTVNGTNDTFVVDHKPLADNNYDDIIDPTDVTAYVNGATVDIASIDATTGEVELVTAPANGTTVTLDYSYSPVSPDAVADVIEETEDWINEEMSAVVTTPYTTTNLPKRVRLIARTFAAGVLMSRYFAMQSNEEGTSAGNAKIKLAETWLAAYRLRMSDNGSDVGEVSVPRSSADVRLFQTYDISDGSWGPLADEGFRLNGIE